MEKKEQPVAVLAQKAEAIDFTPIYMIRVVKTLRPGDVLRFDVAETDIYKNTPSSS